MRCSLKPAAILWPPPVINMLFDRASFIKLPIFTSPQDLAEPIRISLSSGKEVITQEVFWYLFVRREEIRPITPICSASSSSAMIESFLRLFSYSWIANSRQYCSFDFLASFSAFSSSVIWSAIEAVSEVSSSKPR